MGPLAAGTALYALYLVLVVILGRTGRTELSFPATATAVVVNVGLNLILVPEYGIVGAGVALVVSTPLSSPSCTRSSGGSSGCRMSGGASRRPRSWPSR